MNSPFVKGVSAVFCVLAVLLIFSSRATAKKVDSLRTRGVYPEPGKGTKADVLRLVELGEKIIAIRCYREITGQGLKESKDAVEAMMRKLRK
jgi:ribosomal protein L7/L12